MRTLVLGIGNTLLTDEGVGVHIIKALSEFLPPGLDGVELLDGGTLSFTLAGPIEEAETLVVVDAAELKSPPGTLRVFEGEAMDAFLLSNRKSSVHEVGLADLRAIAILAGHWPQRRALVAVQPQLLDWGEFPTAAVAAAVPEACRRIVELIGAWRDGAQ
ncbi:MAG TPA: HyaD/HybD family hydrogenase maturation endopeptidase [Thiobacillaceae bacterium]|nr:HyaD/HybD family hydrogenase maturation endopeptidase [Thiobacillaceae bacterium]